MLPRVQILRAVAALGVLLLHAGAMIVGTPLESLAKGVAHIGYAGVDVFFTISGFLLAHTFKPGTTRARFLASRAARIYSGFWAILAFCALLFWLSGRRMWKYDWGMAATLWPMDMAEMPIPLTWTLYHELYFYVVFALLIGLSVKWRNRVLAVYAVGIAGLHAWYWSRGLYTPEHWGELPGSRSQLGLLMLSPYLLEFIAGVWLQAWLATPSTPYVAPPPVRGRQGGGRPAWGVAATAESAGIPPPRSSPCQGKEDNRSMEHGSAAWLLVAGICGFILAAIADSFYKPGLIAGWFNWQRVLWMAPPSLLLVGWAVRSDAAKRPLARGTGWLIPIGNASYALFLLQVPLLRTIDALVPAEIKSEANGRMLLFAASVLGIVAFSFVWLRWIERPLAKVSGRLVDRVFPLSPARAD